LAPARPARKLRQHFGQPRGKKRGFCRLSVVGGESAGWFLPLMAGFGNRGATPSLNLAITGSGKR